MGIGGATSGEDLAGPRTTWPSRPNYLVKHQPWNTHRIAGWKSLTQGLLRGPILVSWGNPWRFEDIPNLPRHALVRSGCAHVEDHVSNIPEFVAVTVPGKRDSANDHLRR